MKVTCHGAAGDEVTGSAYHLQTAEASVLIDFGRGENHWKNC
jgi:hypothetical protein